MAYTGEHYIIRLVYFGAQLFGCSIEDDLVIQVCDMAELDRFFTILILYAHRVTLGHSQPT